ncbi:hypothetical protein CCP3SC15_3370001 [Gammaproteobacteria bacterium]
MSVPQPNYFAPASFGSLELRKRADTEFIGQQISYEENVCATVRMLNLDALALSRLDFVKLDVEGMELEILIGGRTALSRHHPIMVVEVIKSDHSALINFLVELGYHVFTIGINLLAVHSSDPTLKQIKIINNKQLVLSE